eukprot:1159931-Rhodomonas_salina.1
MTATYDWCPRSAVGTLANLPSRQRQQKKQEEKQIELTCSRMRAEVRGKRKRMQMQRKGGGCSQVHSCCCLGRLELVSAVSRKHEGGEDHSKFAAKNRNAALRAGLG